MTLPLRKIGNAEVHPVGFGAMGISAFYGKVESDEERFKVCRSSSKVKKVGKQISLQVLDAVYASGCRHIDTAHIYADSEALLGKWYENASTIGTRCSNIGLSSGSKRRASAMRYSSLPSLESHRKALVVIQSLLKSNSPRRLNVLVSKPSTYTINTGAFVSSLAGPLLMKPDYS